MTVRAVIFDVYATLLEVGAPPVDADAHWRRLFIEMLGTRPPLTRTEFSVRSAHVIAGHHAAARAQGIPWPEINWPLVVTEVLPQLAELPPDQFSEFLLRQMAVGRTLRLAQHAAECLCQLSDHRLALGIASNSQAYTLRELDTALQGADLNLSIFDPDLCFWSYKHGFSKPDPHVFRILSARLEARGIRPAETLMVGDRLDNDIAPARAQGWQTWHLKPGRKGKSRDGGGFRELRSALT